MTVSVATYPAATSSYYKRGYTTPGTTIQQCIGST